MKKWLVDNAKWTLPPLIVAVLIASWIVYTMVGHGALKFAFTFLGILLAFGLYHLTHQTVGQRFNMPGVRSSMVIIVLMIPIFCWFFWAIKPEWYEGWRNSTFFPLMIITALVLGWLSGSKNSVANVARTALILLCLVAIGKGAYEKVTQERDEQQKKEAAKQVAEQKARSDALANAVYIMSETDSARCIDTSFVVPVDSRKRAIIPAGKYRTTFWRVGHTLPYGITGDDGVEVELWPQSQTPVMMSDSKTWQLRALDGKTGEVTVRIFPDTAKGFPIEMCPKAKIAPADTTHGTVPDTVQKPPLPSPRLPLRKAATLY
ncbi:hypothetical protein KW785_00125 [Candidatus Parcubacteria bacterium]|nr:hypothetical protein [Candidatus Parcubacteria bacterium]